jgi:hypothetical protein
MATNEKPSERVEHDERSNNLEDHANVTAMEATSIANGAIQATYPILSLGMLRLYSCLLVGYLCATMNGFDGSVMGFVATPQFRLQVSRR